MTDRATENKIILIIRKTRLEELVIRFNTESQARFYIEHLGADFSDYKNEHDTYQRSLHAAEEALLRLGRLQVVDRSFVPNFIFGPTDTVVVLGQDGLVANVLKYLESQPIIGVNPDPKRWEGILLPFTVAQIPAIIPEVFAAKRPINLVTMAKATLNTGQQLYGVNDLFIGPKSHTSARYHIQAGEVSEEHSSSGIIVSTGLGSTGWLRSILAGAVGIAKSMPGVEIAAKEEASIQWDSDYLIFSVREPWPSKTSSAKITFGRVTEGKPLVITSHMPENGVIFSDGIEHDFLEFNSGTTATISIAENKGRIVK